MAKDVWGSEEDAQEFMVKRHPMLDDRSPFEASLTEIGAREVESILGRLLFGSAA
jgi:putative toxin-antitoxin system antitoxin component (TIGR02293 family)